MADYYTLLSFVIPNLDAKEKEWWKKYIGGELKIASPDWWGLDQGPYRPCSMHLETEPDGSDQLWCHSEDSADLDFLADLLFEFLKDTDTHRIIKVEWSNSCSKPRTDGFGGGAIIISKSKMIFMNTDKWLDDVGKYLDDVYDPEKPADNKVFAGATAVVDGDGSVLTVSDLC